jgi:hypothetical protein
MLAMGIVLYVVNLAKTLLLLLKCISRRAARIFSYQRLINFIHRRGLIRILNINIPFDY